MFVDFPVATTDSVRSPHETKTTLFESGHQPAGLVS
jgi:hypothetical protein